MQIKLAQHLSDEQVEGFADAFVMKAIEAQGLQVGLSTWHHECEGYIQKWRGSVTEANRTEIGRWLAGRSDVLSYEFGPLKDAWL